MLNIFVGVPQSKYAAIAILFALAAVSVAILFGRDPVPIGQKFMFILLMFVLALPGLLLTLFQLTCLVTGAGMRNQRWWCSAYAWIGTVLILLYAVVLVVVAVMSIVNGTDVQKDLIAMEAETFRAQAKSAEHMAAEYFENAKEEEKAAQGYDAPPAMPSAQPETFEGASDMIPEEYKKMYEKVVSNKVESFNASEIEPFSSCGSPLM